MRGSRLRALALLVFLLPAGAGAEPLDLARAVSLALSRNPGLKAVEERRSEVVGGIEEARADAFPQLALVSSWNRSRNPALLNSPDFAQIVENFPGGSFRPQEQELNHLGVEVTQPLYTFGKIGAAVDLAKEVAAATEAQIEAARLDTALAAAVAYYDLLAAQEALATFKEQERARREALAVVQARYDIGEATRLELLQAQATLSELLPDLASTEGQIEVARARLRGILALAADSPLEVKPVAREELAEPPAAAVLLAEARRERPELADLERQAEALRSQQEVTRADGRPQIELTGRYGREARVAGDLSDPLFADWSVNVGLRWEFFDGGRRKGQVAQLESRRRQLELQRRDLLDSIRLEIEEAISDYRTARARLRAAGVAVTSAREAARVAEESYREGVALQADWLDAQQRETEAEIRIVDAYYQALERGAEVARAVGLLPTEDWMHPAED